MGWLALAEGRVGLAAGLGVTEQSPLQKFLVEMYSDPVSYQLEAWVNSGYLIFGCGRPDRLAKSRSAQNRHRSPRVRVPFENGWAAGWPEICKRERYLGGVVTISQPLRVRISGHALIAPLSRSLMSSRRSLQLIRSG